MADGVEPSLQAFIDYQTFNLLPFAGGLYDQDPQLMRDFRFIQSLINEHQSKKR